MSGSATSSAGRTSAAVRLEGLSKYYGKDAALVHALKDVSLEIPKRRFCCVIGPSGSGKTTMLNLIGCLDNPSSGRISLDGTDVTSLSDNERTAMRARSIGYIFQHFSLIPVLSVYENVEYPLLLMGVNRSARRRRVDALLKSVGLDAEKGRRPNELSGGQRQRVAIARALVKEPKIVLADEPTANLDSETGASIMALMKAMLEEHATTFVFATHDSQIMRIADHVWSLRDGKLQSDAGRSRA
jgi:putative ABC transport system ATP-binding protein